MLNLIINGKDKTFDGSVAPKMLADLLDLMNINQATVVAEIDGEIIERQKFSETKLINDQSIELIRFVGGG